MTEQPSPEIKLTPEEARAVLAWCRENAADEEAIVRLNELLAAQPGPEFAKDIVDVAEAVSAPLIASSPPTPAAQAHMIILLASLLGIESERDRVDAILAGWMRNASTFGPDRATPPPFQRSEFVQRVADLLGWGTLEIGRDRGALARFLAWVNSWTVKNKFKIKRTLDAMRRNFPAPDLYKMVHFPKPEHKEHKGPKGRKPKGTEKGGAQEDSGLEGAAEREGPQGKGPLPESGG